MRHSLGSRYRCEDGRLMRHDPQSDDPYLETDRGKCPDCDGKGCKEPEEGEPDEPDQEVSKPVMLCTCGTVLETPAKYAEHCAAFPSHFTQS